MSVTKGPPFRVVPVLHQAGCLLALLLLSLTCGPSAAAQGPPPIIRVMTYNIHHGRGIDGVLDLERIAHIIVESSADIVALQEVDRHVERSEQLDIVARLAELTELEHTAFGKNIDLQGGSYGNAVLSRYPITSQQNNHLRQLATGEQRGVLEVVVDVDGRRLTLLNTHLDHREDESERLFNIRQIREEILPRFDDDCLIFAGDFNDIPGSDMHREMRKMLDDAWPAAGNGEGLTFPSKEPDRRIDYVWHGEALDPRSGVVLETPASDHLPLVIEFEMCN